MKVINKFLIWCLYQATAWSLFGLLVLLEKPSLAQSKIIPDNTLGTENSTVVTNFKNLPIEVITGGATRGINLFHSFQEFNVGKGRSAYFLSPSVDIQNIFARVTGSNRSEILGRLGTFGESKPNLFLMNPNGIIFGKNASLDVDGSFAATTANAIQFGGRGNFSATNPEIPQLLTINPSAFLFSQINQTASIQNNSVAPVGKDLAGVNVFGLRVPNGKSLLLVGGNVSMDGGQLNAYGGRVELGGLAAPGNINLISDGNNLRLGFPENLTCADVSLTNHAAVYVEGSGGGNIAVNARNISILGDSLLSAGIGIGLGTVDSQAGDITLNASEKIQVGQSSLIQNAVAPLATGKSGNIDINAGSLSLTDGAQLLTIIEADSQTAGRGDAGNVNTKVTGAIDIAGKKNGVSSGIGSFVETGTVGNGGNITIDSGSLLLRDGARLSASTYGQGNAGNIVVKAGQIALLNASGIDARTDSKGNAGNIKVDTNKLMIQDGSLISVSPLSNSTGKGGNLIVNSTESIEIAGTSEDNYASGLFFETLGAGRGGDLQVTTKRLTIRDGGFISGGTRGSGKAGNVTIDASELVEVIGVAKNQSVSSGIGVDVKKNASGDAGNLRINTKHLVVRDGAFIAADTRENSTGNGGNLVINATDSVEVIGRTPDRENPTAISVDVIDGGTGNAGNLTIDTQRLVIKDGAQVTAKNFGSGQPGQILINAGESVDVIGGKDTLTLINAVAGPNATGKPGDIRINTKRLVLQDGGQIAALTAGTIDGGNIQINATDSIEISGQVFDSLSQESGVLDIFQRSGILALSVPITDNFVGVRGGDITIKTGNLNVRNNGQISTSGLGNSFAGDIDITSSKVTLDNSGRINAESESGNGGNINLNSDLLLLSRNSQITTNAGTAEAGGDGGNINVNSKFIVAIPNQNNDITANAYSGKGGNINIQSQGIFGIEPRTQASDTTNDITASSNLGISGNVNINSPDNSTIQNSLTELPTNAIDTNTLIANSCIVRTRKQKGTFNITGTGGLPYRPGDAVLSSYPTGTVRSIPSRTSRPWKKGDPIVEPTGIYRLPNGQLVMSRECQNNS